MAQSIAIVGAGIGGLTLGRILARCGIPYVIYDRSPSPRLNNYGITLLPEQLPSLCQITGISNEADLVSRLAVDSAIGGRGFVQTQWSDDIPKQKQTLRSSGAERGRLGPFRANRARLESLLAAGLDIKYGHAVSSIDITTGEPTLRFTSEESAKHRLVVAADGVHSIVRNCLLPGIKPRVHPIVAIYGKRRIPKQQFLNWTFGSSHQRLAYTDFKLGALADSPEHLQDVVTRISVADTTDEGDSVTVEYVYSRASRGSADPLYKPDRSTGEAKRIDESLFDELSQSREYVLSRQESFSSMWKTWNEVFDTAKVRDDRKLSWLMRSVVQPGKEVLSTLADKGILFIGDAVHAEPILGGQGANNAIDDAIHLADRLRGQDNQDLSGFYEHIHEGWTASGYRSDEKIMAMHNIRKGATSTPGARSTARPKEEQKL